MDNDDREVYFEYDSLNQDLFDLETINFHLHHFFGCGGESGSQETWTYRKVN